jgi:hypothetical protein
MSDIPDLTREPLMSVDATPDAGYPLRILNAHRANSLCEYVVDPPSALWDAMNEMQRERVRLLDAAIAKLGAVVVPEK